MKRTISRSFQVWALAAALALAVATAHAQRSLNRGLSQDQEDQLAQKHDGYYGALAPENLAKPRPKPPVNFTGTWFINLRHAFGDFMFGPPYPQFYAAGQQALRDGAAARKAGKPYRDSIGQCYPAGMPMIMTRVWPIAIIQLPTAIYLTDSFFDSLRVIYLDGRKHTDPDIVIDTYNGESIGHWEGKTLVVDIQYFEPNQHYIDMGIPISEKLHIIERWQLLDQGKTLQIAYDMTDPDMWKGEWRSTKRWIREDYSDIPENECLPNLNQNLPSTSEGHAAAEKESHVKAPAAPQPPPASK